MAKSKIDERMIKPGLQCRMSRSLGTEDTIFRVTRRLLAYDNIPVASRRTIMTTRAANQNDFHPATA
jgi:hypothetical protein